MDFVKKKKSIKVHIYFQYRKCSWEAIPTLKSCSGFTFCLLLVQSGFQSFLKLTYVRVGKENPVLFSQDLVTKNNLSKETVKQISNTNPIFHISTGLVILCCRNLFGFLILTCFAMPWHVFAKVPFQI